jgi:hypothetical protein
MQEGFLQGNLKGRARLEDLETDECVILKLILMIQDGRM